MPSYKPENHVTRGMRERVAGGGGSTLFTPPPRVPDAVASWLAQQYPPRCYDPKKENLEAHLLYAGKVQLIEELQGLVDRQRMGESALAALANDDETLSDDERHATLDRLKED